MRNCHTSNPRIDNAILIPRRVVIFIAAALLVFSLAFANAPTAAAMPSEEDIANAKKAQEQTASSLASVHVELANLEAQSIRLSEESAAAQEKFDEAAAVAQEAQQEAEQAQKKADDAAADVDQARKDMGSIAQAIYQNSAGNLAQAYYFLDADSLNVGAAQDRAYTIVADHADRKVKSFEALQDVADNLQKFADQKSQKAQELMQEADVAADQAAQAAAAAQAQVDDTAARKAELEVKLADQKVATAKLESEREAALEAQRIAREKAAAEKAAAEKAAAEKAAAEKAAQEAAAKADQMQAAPEKKADTQSDVPAPQVSSSKPIVDVSAWQSPSAINYDALAASVSGVVIRIGYTGTYSGSSLNKDSAFERHYTEFSKRGVPIGIYWYSCANGGNEGAAEAQAALDYLDGRHIDMPIYIDVEDPDHQSGASKSTLTQQSLQFAETTRAGGYETGIYASSSWFYSKLDLGALQSAGMSIWVAQWSDSAPSIDYDLWQYSSSGYLPGYGGRLDVNRR